jgi:type I restriction enzyme S subunit
MNFHWPTTTLKEGTAFLRDGTHFSPTSKTGPYRYVTSKNIRDGYMDLTDCCYISEKDHRRIFDGCPVQRGDVLLTKDGASVGNVCQNNLQEEFSLLSSVAVIRGKPDLLKNDFLLQFFLSPFGKRAILGEVAGQAITRVTLTTISQLKVPVPPLDTQSAIVSVLSAWDRGIRQLSDLIAAKLRFKQGLMQQLLTGRRRFPEFTDDWDRRSIGSFLVESRIPGTHGAEAKKLTVKLYGKGVIPKTETRAGSIATKYYQRKAGQFIYSKLDFLNGAFGIIPTELDGFESTLDLPAFDISDSVDPDWFRFFVVRESFYKNLLGLANGGRKARRVNPDDLLKVSIPFPAKPEQSRIADTLNTADREIDLLRKELDALKTQKKGLMQKLLTGQVRVASGGR